MNYELLSFVKRSERRKQIIKVLRKASTPSEIADEVGVSVSHVSRTLKEFVEKDIAVCQTPDAKIGKIYELTEEGRKILEEID